MDNINITLKLYGGLDKHINDYNPEKGISLRFDSNETIIDILKKLGIPKHRITLVMVDNEIVSLDHIVKNDDLVKIFSHIGGG